MQVSVATAPGRIHMRRAQKDPWVVRRGLSVLAGAVVAVLIVVPVVNVFYEALARGPAAYWAALFDDPDTLSAIRLTLIVAPIAVLMNTAFGLAAAWATARFQFRGRSLLVSLIDLPFAVSPVVAGLVIMLIFGLQGWLGPWLREMNVKIVFATPGLVIATAFVTLPFVARELIPLMEAVGPDEEIAAVSLGALARHLFWRVTLPNIKWGLLYGMILCNARAMGEFGAVYVVSGRITGRTDTMPLRVEKLFQEYNTQQSFAVASLLSSLALVTLTIKTALEWQTRRQLHSRLREAAETTEATEGNEARPASRLRLVEPPRRVEPSPAVRREETMRVGIAVRNVTKRFDDFVALDDVSIDVPHGSLVALLGPSGSGKTTLLRIISGLDKADSGTILYHDEDATRRTARERNVGFVFQHYALFRHMSVFENIAFGLRVRRWKAPEITARVNELLRLVQLEGMGQQAPSQLSGGQRQRVALARALAAQPKVLLLDEPFGALDAKVRQELRNWLRKLHDEIHVTSVFVTHDQEEAFEVADQVVVMSHGKVEQVGTPDEVFDRPANAFVMDFLGNVNVFHGRVEAGRARVGGFDVAFPAPHPHHHQQPVRAYVRPHELEIDRTPQGASSVAAEVLRVNRASARVKVELRALDLGIPINVELSRDRHAELALRPGETVYVFPSKVRFFVEDQHVEDYQI